MPKLSSQNRRDFIKLLAASASASYIALPSQRVFAQTKAPLRILTLIDTYGIPTANRNELWVNATSGDYALTESHLGRILQPLKSYVNNMALVSNMDMSSQSQTGDSRTHHYLTTHTLTGSSALTETRDDEASFQIKHASIDVHIGQYLHSQYGLARPRIYDHLFFTDYASRDATTFCYTADGAQKRSIAGALNVKNTLFVEASEAGASSDGEKILNITNNARIEAISLVQERINALSDNLANASHEEVRAAYQNSVEDVAQELRLKNENVVTLPAELDGVVNGARATSENLPSMFKNIYHAFAFDMASSITYAFGGEKINQLRHNYLYDAEEHNDDDVSGLLGANFHAASHRTDDTANKVHEIVRTFQAQELATLLDRLSTTVDSDGSMVMDNTLVFYTCQMSNNTHQTRDYPYLMIAGKNTNIQGGFHYDGSNLTHNDLMVTLAQGVTMPDDNFGGHNRTGEYVSSLNNGPISKMLKP